MKNWKIWTAFLSVFIAGLIIGAVGFGAILRHQFPPPGDHDEFRNKIRARMMDHIRDEVRPDESALQAIEAEIDLTIRKVEAIRKEVHPKVEAVFKDSHERIREHLTDEQRIRFNAMLEAIRKGRPGLFGPPLPPPPPF